MTDFDSGASAAPPSPDSGGGMGQGVSPTSEPMPSHSGNGAESHSDTIGGTVAPVARPPQPRTHGQFAPRPQPPQAWPADIRNAHWARLDPSLQTYLANREAETHKAITGYGERVKSYAPYDQLLTDYTADFQQHGINNPVDGIRALLEAQRMLARDPRNAIAYLMQNSGLTPQHFLPDDHDSPRQQAQHRASELERQLMESAKQLATVKQELAETKEQVRKHEHAREAKRAASANVRDSGHAFRTPKTIDDTLEEIARKHYRGH